MSNLLLSLILLLIASTSFALDVDMQVEVRGRDTSMVDVKTNLPDGVKATIHIYSDNFDYHQYIDSEVIAGHFKPTGPISAAMSPGVYQLELSLGPAQFQPAEIKTLIGERGEKLEGGLVKKGMLGKTVYFKTGITIE